MDVLYSILLPATFVLTLGSIAFIFKRFIRPKFPVTVCCWFCKACTKVPYGNKNCWDCPDCEQYNGFKQDGDYNKQIPAQYSEDMNYSITCQKSEFIGGHNVLCPQCNANQLLKVKQLANFSPYHQNNYEEEVDCYERHLEMVYGLCSTCEYNVKYELQKQNQILSEKLDLTPVRAAKLDNTEEVGEYSPNVFSRIENYRASHLLNLVSSVCAVLLTINCASHMYPTYTSTLHLHVNGLDHWINYLSLIGTTSCFFSRITVGKRRLHAVDALVCPLWLVLLLIYHPGIAHTSNSITAYQLVTTAVTAMLLLISLLIHRNLKNLPKQHIRRLEMVLSFRVRLLSIKNQNCQLLTLEHSCSDNSSIALPSASEAADTMRMEEIPPDNDIDDTLSELDAFSFGPPSSPNRSQGFVSNSSPSSAHFKETTLLEQLRQRRPLITPAKLSVPKSSSSPLSPADVPFGVNCFAGETIMEFYLFNLDISFSPTGSKFSERDFLLRNPFVSSFSSRSQLDDSFSFNERLNNGIPKNPSLKSFQYRETGLAQPVRDTKDKDSDSSESVCQVDSTTKSDSQIPHTEGWWKQPGFIGFVMGASVVGNVVLLASMMWGSSS
ncbi:hypothetical protein ScPMuIL_008653 [Solemya velum]